ncbi:hypothetical protein [Gottfriedia acidiceleris]|uniref:hypothetical protein n=1 Tax=Gottfriedia acidiceleris TaxID=371036 RepID=UPI003D238FDA
MAKFISDDVRKKIVELFYKADSLTRNDLSLDENSYLTDLTSNLKREKEKMSISDFGIYTVKMPAGPERTLGADGIIIFENQNLKTVKIGMFEAKWLIEHNGKYRDSWDENNLKKAFSRYTNELIKQLKIPSQVAVFTMFQSMQDLDVKNIDFPSFSLKGTTNVWSDTVLDYVFNKNNRNRLLNSSSWKKEDAQYLVKKGVNLGDVINEILLCHKGKQIDITDVKKENIGTRFVSVKDGENKLLIPIPSIDIYKNYHTYSYKKLEKWMLKKSLSTFIHVKTGRRID